MYDIDILPYSLDMAVRKQKLLAELEIPSDSSQSKNSIKVPCNHCERIVNEDGIYYRCEEHLKIFCHGCMTHNYVDVKFDDDAAYCVSTIHAVQPHIWKDCIYKKITIQEGNLPSSPSMNNDGQEGNP